MPPQPRQGLIVETLDDYNLRKESQTLFNQHPVVIQRSNLPSTKKVIKQYISYST